MGLVFLFILLLLLQSSHLLITGSTCGGVAIDPLWPRSLYPRHHQDCPCHQVLAGEPGPHPSHPLVYIRDWRVYSAWYRVLRVLMWPRNIFRSVFGTAWIRCGMVSRTSLSDASRCCLVDSRPNLCSYLARSLRAAGASFVIDVPYSRRGGSTRFSSMCSPLFFPTSGT